MRKTRDNKCLQQWGEKGNLGYCWGTADWFQSWVIVGKALQKLELERSYDPVSPLLGIYSKEIRSSLQKEKCTPMFTVALFTIAKIWIQSKYPLMNEPIKKMWAGVVHDYNPSTLGGQGRWITRSRVQDQPDQYGETLSLLKIQKSAG